VSLPRLHGPQVSLVPVPYDVAVAVVAGRDVTPPLAAVGLEPGPGWPHADSPDALRPLAEHGGPGEDGGWLISRDSKVMGECGWRGGPDADGDVELGYGLAGPAREQGVGTEAVALLSAWAEQQPGVRRLVAEVQVGNEASRRVLARLGFEEETARPSWVRCVRATGPPPARKVRGRHVC
jgi:ribosomal-protein-alanine N-acetyltransferase